MSMTYAYDQAVATCTCDMSLVYALHALYSDHDTHNDSLSLS